MRLDFYPTDPEVDEDILDEMNFVDFYPHYPFALGVDFRDPFDTVEAFGILPPAYRSPNDDK